MSRVEDYLNHPDSNSERNKCKDFLENFREFSVRKYHQILQLIADRSEKCLEILIDDVIKFKDDIEFVSNIETNTVRYIRYFEDVADELMPAALQASNNDVFDVLNAHRQNQSSEDPNSLTPIPQSLTRRYEIVIIPRSIERPRKLREIKASDIGHLVKMKGMVSRVTDVKPQVSVVTYTCDYCGSEIYQEVSGNKEFMPLTKCPSQRCIDNKTSGRINIQTRGCKFIKYQELRVQELPDQVPVGHIPRSMTVHCRGEQTRQCGPGDIIVVSGIFLTVRYSGFRGIKAGLQSDSFVEAMHIEKQKLAYNELLVDDRVKQQVEEVSCDPDPYTRLALSIAPEIFGHEDVKKALLLQLVGGLNRQLPDGMKIRGDINLCLMGDPGVAKSQLLKYIASTAPRGVYTTGKGSSGVGLTASVVRDTLTGDMALEGGALVLADRGICCIDEFDKMDENDRTAIHEVMEQQTISIAKAGITTTLNARAAVLAAANPLQGRYNKYESVSKNINLPNSLLSRFDLLFLILDKVDMTNDLALSKHVLHVHKFLVNPNLSFIPLEPNTIKQYIAAARQLDPMVPQELTSYIVEAYVSLRMNDNSSSKRQDQTGMTARLLLSILRMSQALARIRLSDRVSHEDVDEAIRLTHASKSSLLDDPTTALSREDTTSAIFSTIRDLPRVQGNRHQISYSHAEAIVIRKGFTSQQLKKCLEEYAELGVLHYDLDSGLILFNE